jgi:hypothetical protein
MDQRRYRISGVFAAFRRRGEERRLEEPQQLEAVVVRNYRMLVDA